ncbi:MAG TPA: hypothetical protein PKH77_27695 [Anaerolineae bacterium]|nr:hypothetical protein [Anaerolineae bacterium]
MYAIRMNVTTNGSGAGSVTIPFEAFPCQEPGISPLLLYAVEWIDGDFADGVDAVLSAETTPSGVARTLLTLTDANSDAWYFPRELEHGNNGAVLSTHTLPVVHGDLKLTITSGGNAKTGGCIVYLLDA